MTVKFVLSSSVQGQPIGVGIVPIGLHQVPPNVTDCITLYASNPNSVDDSIIVFWQNTFSTQHRVPCLETVMLLDRIPLTDEELLGARTITGALRVVGFIERTAA